MRRTGFNAFAYLPPAGNSSSLGASSMFASLVVDSLCILACAFAAVQRSDSALRSARRKRRGRRNWRTLRHFLFHARSIIAARRWRSVLRDSELNRPASYHHRRTVSPTAQNSACFPDQCRAGRCRCERGEQPSSPAQCEIDDRSAACETGNRSAKPTRRGIRGS